MSDAILAFAHDRNRDEDRRGKPRRRLWTRILIGSIVDTLVQGSVTSTSTSSAPSASRACLHRRPPARDSSDWAPYVWAIAVVALASGVAWLTLPFFELANLVMVYLLGSSSSRHAMVEGRRWWPPS